MTARRIVVCGATMALTRRTILRKALLGDQAPEVEGVWLYALADAAGKHDVLVHHAVRVVTHHHATVTLTRPNLGESLHCFHRGVSCGLNVPLAAYGYEQPKNVFDARQTHAMRLLNSEAEQQHLVYERLNPPGRLPTHRMGPPKTRFVAAGRTMLHAWKTSSTLSHPSPQTRPRLSTSSSIGICVSQTGARMSAPTSAKR